MLSSHGEYEVQDGQSRLLVSLNKETCICGRWQLSGIPCKHGMRGILHAGLEPLQFVDSWYSIQRYKAAYGNGIKPITDIEQWPELNFPEIQPPKLKRGVGRPSRNRRRGDEEERKGRRSKTVVCSVCKEAGHNKKNCKGGLTTKQKKAKGKSPTDEPSTSKGSREPKKDKVASSQPSASKTPKQQTKKRVAASQSSTTKANKKQKKR